MRECELCGNEAENGLSWCIECIKNEWKCRHADYDADNVVCGRCNKKRNAAYMVKGRNHCKVCQAFAWYKRTGGMFELDDYERQYFKSKDNLRKFIR